jgi:hypothetical protein
MKIKISLQELENLITESITEEIFIIRRKIELLSKIIDNFDQIDCNKPTAQTYERVYCQNLKKFDVLELEQARDSLRTKFDDLIKQEFRKKRLVKK